MILNPMIIGSATGMLGNATSYAGFSTYTFALADRQQTLLVNPNTGIWKPVNIQSLIYPQGTVFSVEMMDRWQFLDPAIQTYIVAAIAVQVTAAVSASATVTPTLWNTSGFLAGLTVPGTSATTGAQSPLVSTGDVGDAPNFQQNFYYGTGLVAQDEASRGNIESPKPGSFL